MYMLFLFVCVSENQLNAEMYFYCFDTYFGVAATENNLGRLFKEDNDLMTFETNTLFQAVLVVEESVCEAKRVVAQACTGCGGSIQCTVSDEGSGCSGRYIEQRGSRVISMMVS